MLFVVVVVVAVLGDCWLLAVGDHLGSAGIIWHHLGLSGIIWLNLSASWLIKAHLGSSGGASGILSDHLGFFGLILNHLVSSGLTPAGIIWEDSGKARGGLWEVSRRSFGSSRIWALAPGKSLESILVGAEPRTWRCSRGPGRAGPPWP